MTKLRERLNALAKALGLQHALRSKARRQMFARHKEQAKFERQASAARKAADELRSAEHIAKADRKDAKALKLDAKAQRACSKAITYKQRAKRKTQVIHGLKTSKADLEAKLATLKPHVGKDGKVAGAENEGEAFIFANRFIAAKCASADRPNFYDMYGSGFNVKHALLKGDQPHIGQMQGERSDCSLFGTEACWAAKLPDPNGQHYKGGYTGTGLAQNNGWRRVSETEMRKRGWGIVIYLRYSGDTVGHHWENYVGEGGDETIGHGSAPVDPGVVNLFGDGLYACLVWN